MPENPLLPNAQLRALHALLKQAVPLSKAPRAKKTAGTTALTGREALLAGTLLQLGTGDILVPEPGDVVPATLLASRAEPGGESASRLMLSPGSPQLTLAASLADALRTSASDRLVFTLLRAGNSEPDWAETLRRAESTKLPIVFACADPSGADTFRATPQAASAQKAAPLNWTSVQKVASKAKLPVLSVDGQDAVAVYRVMQESILRARSGGGPALIWAMLPTQDELRSQPRSAAPLSRLERYLRTRQIAF